MFIVFTVERIYEVLTLLSFLLESLLLLFVFFLSVEILLIFLNPNCLYEGNFIFIGIKWYNPQIETIQFFFFQFLNFFSHIALIKIASIMRNRGSDNYHLLFIPNLSKKACSCAILIQVEICASSSYFAKHFYPE